MQKIKIVLTSLNRSKSPPIVSGVPDMHPLDCPNVEETLSYISL